MTRLARQKIAGAPELRRALMRERAAPALPARAKLAIVPPQDMHGTDKPILMGRIELDALAIGENARPAHERDVVKMDHVKAAPKNLANTRPVDKRPAQLLRGEAGQGGRTAAQAVHGEALGLGQGSRSAPPPRRR